MTMLAQRLTRRLTRGWRFVLAALCLSVSTLACATPSYADLWWNPSESGWGITISQQQSTLFGTWFIYRDGKPYWVVAVLVPGADSRQFTGTLYETSGPSFAAPFSPASVVSRAVGQASITFNGVSRATLAYTIDGASVVKSIERQTLVPLQVAGNFEGETFGAGIFNADSTDFRITLTNAGEISIERAAFFAGTCRLRGTYTQYGQRLSAAGAYQCSDFTEGTWRTDDLTVLDDFALVATVSLKVNGTGPETVQRFLGGRR